MGYNVQAVHGANFETAPAQAERLGMALHLSVLTDGAHLGHRDVLWWVPI